MVCASASLLRGLISSLLANQPVVRAEELEADGGWLGGVVEAVNVATDGLEEVVAAADVDVGADEVVRGDIEKLAVAALRGN